MTRFKGASFLLYEMYYYIYVDNYAHYRIVKTILRVVYDEIRFLFHISIIYTVYDYKTFLNITLHPHFNQSATAILCPPVRHPVSLSPSFIIYQHILRNRHFFKNANVFTAFKAYPPNYIK